MTASVIPPVIPSSAPVRGRAGSAAAGSRRLPLAGLPPRAAPPGDVVYGLARVDASGRVADRMVLAALGWRDGDRLTITADAGVVVARRDPGGMVTLPARPCVVIPAALVLLDRMGLSPADLLAVPADRPAVPTFAEYVPVVSAAVSAGARRAYGSYWNRVVEQWGDRRLDEPTPSEIRQLMAYVRSHLVARRNGRGGRSAAEHLVAALRCLYRHAEDDKIIAAADNPARKVEKPRRLPSTRGAVPDTRLAEINEIAATTGNDPELDTMLRLHTETACRRGGALALRTVDLDSEQCLILLREKGETSRWQPVRNAPSSWEKGLTAGWQVTTITTGAQGLSVATTASPGDQPAVTSSARRSPRWSTT